MDTVRSDEQDCNLQERNREPHWLGGLNMDEERMLVLAMARFYIIVQIPDIDREIIGIIVGQKHQRVADP